MFFLKMVGDQDQELEYINDNSTLPIPANLQWRAWAAAPAGITGEVLLDFVNLNLFTTSNSGTTTAGPCAKVIRDAFENAGNVMKSGQLMPQMITAVDFNNLTERQYFGDIYAQILNDL